MAFTIPTPAPITRWCMLALVLMPLSPAVAADFTRDAEQLAAATALEQVKANNPPAAVYATFNRFCATHFAAEREPMVYATFGDQLEIPAEGRWLHPSTHSAAIAWRTNLPALTWVEYGETDAYGLRSDPPERPFATHLHHIVDLEPGTTYHYRLVAEDERGNRVETPDQTFTAGTVDGVILLPGAMEGPPYRLDQEGATYVLTRDIVAAGTAFEIAADGITLDLGGREVVFHDETLDPAVFTDKWKSYDTNGVSAIRSWNHQDLTLLNGRIVEGKGENRGNDESSGFNPIYLRGGANLTLAGLSVDYHTPQTAGIRLRSVGDTVLVHHCAIRDRGTKMHNRHGSGCTALNFLACKGTGYVAHDVLVKRTRQNGLTRLHHLHHCEVYVDSWATNSFATSVQDGCESHDNRIFATGYHAIACPWGDGIKVHRNFIHMEGINTGRTRWWEGFGDQNSMNGLRHTQWGSNKTESTDSDYADNVVLVYASNGSMARGVEFFADPYIRGLTLRESYIQAVSRDDQTEQVTCVATHGLPKRRADHHPVTYLDCVLASNVNMIRIGDKYGRGDNHHFIDCTLRRLGDRASFATFEAQSTHWSMNHVVRDATLEGGAALDHVDWGETKAGTRDYRVEWSVSLQAQPGAEVTIHDALGATAFTGTMPEDGTLVVPLVAYRMHHGGQEWHTPHRISVGHDGQSTEAEVTAAAGTTVSFLSTPPSIKVE